MFLVNLKIGLMHYEKPYTCINQMQHLTCLFQPYVLAFDGVDIHSRESMHYFNQFVYAGCAAKSVKPKPKSKS